MTALVGVYLLGFLFLRSPHSEGSSTFPPVPPLPETRLPSFADWPEEWLAELPRLAEGDQTALERAVERLDQWLRQHAPQDRNFAGSVCLAGGQILSLAGRFRQAKDCFRMGADCRPTHPALVQQLTWAKAGQLPISSGSGFLVAKGGYLLTNDHVVAGPGRLVVRLGADRFVAAQIVAQDQKRDMALLRLALPEGLQLQPQPLALEGGRPVQVGTEVAVLGFHVVLGGQLTTQVNFSDGKISSAPEPANEQMIVITNKVNPGDSGGPLCDEAGRVLGMITAKTPSGRAVESFGLALPASELEAFLRKHLPDYSAPAATVATVKFKEMCQRVSPSVFMVLKVY